MKKLCKCGCGQELINQKNNFLNGHNRKGKTHSDISKIKITISANSKEVQEKKKMTCFKKFGCAYPFQSKEVQEKIKHTINDKYGVENPSKSKEVQEKSKQTCLSKYGVTNPLQSKEVQEKSKQTCLLKYGYEYSLQAKEVREKSKHTCLLKYGVPNSNQFRDIKEKKKRTSLKKFGFDNFSKTPQGRKISSINCIRLIENQIKHNEPMMPHVGDQERLFLNELQQYTSFNIVRQDQSFRYVVGQFPDGHIPELKLFIQFDERFHFVNDDCKNYKDDDIVKTLNLAALGYIIFRISEKQWKENKEQVIDQFKILISERKQ